ncbi:MAG: glycoside hydrolase family 9 protein, partial [Fimbriimonadaceae bacterium]|nr:glycoside hydrolase family 9 protein [Fimbriimonadaceae bacterium]
DNAPEDKPAIEAGLRGPLDVWGWYQDAGDWDGYLSHLRPAMEMLVTYELKPAAFRDGDLNIPESGNRVPDMIDEAAWLPRFYHRLRRELIVKGWGTGGVGSRVCGDHFGSDSGPNNVRLGSWQDVHRTYTVSGEDPFSTFKYAGAAAQLAQALAIAGVRDPEGVDWIKEARESYAWAGKNIRPGDEAKEVGGARLAAYRAYAAAALFRATGDKAFEAEVGRYVQPIPDAELLWDLPAWALMLHALPGGKGTPDQAIHAKTRRLALNAADSFTATAERRAMRFGGNFSMPMLIGQQTTPWALPAIVGWGVARRSDPARAAAYHTAVETTADYFMGANPLNMTWITGIGPRHPEVIFHMDSFVRGEFHPGLTPYGPWRIEGEPSGLGAWDKQWAFKTVHPDIRQWPGAERWFSNRSSPLASEFTIHQQTGPQSAAYGFLLAGPGS